MAIIKKTLFPQNLDRVATYIIDTDVNSKYLKISQLGDTFTGGKNAFLIQGTRELAPGSRIWIEIKDAKGDTIYNEPGEGTPKEYYEGNSKPVAVYIYEDTAFGPGTITILAELEEYEIDGKKYTIPEEWKGRPNMKWQKVVNIHPEMANTTTIRFYKRPKIDISELGLPIFERTEETITISGSIRGRAIEPPAGTLYTGQQVIYQLESINPASASFTNGVHLANAPAAILPDALTGLQINIKGISGSNGLTPFVFTGGLKTSYKIYYSTFNPYINNIISDYKFETSIPFTVPRQDYDSGIPDPDGGGTTLGIPRAGPLLIQNFEYGSFTASYTTNVWKDSGIYSSYANIKITDMETFSGDVYRIKVLADSKNDLQGYRALEDIILENNELLQEAYYINTLNKKTGIFDTVDLVTPNIQQPELQRWNIDNLANQGNAVVDIVARNVTISPDTDITGSNGLFRFFYNKNLNFSSSTEYSLRFTPEFEKITNDIGYLDVYLTGSSFINTNQVLNYGKKITTLSDSTYKKYGEQTINFYPDADGTGSVAFIVRNGKWILKDISIQPSHQTAFSPNQYQFITKPPIQIVSESFDFRFDFFDINYNYVPIKIFKTIQFAGGNDLPQKLIVSASSLTFNTIFAPIITPPYIDIYYEKQFLPDDDIIFISTSNNSTAGAYDQNNVYLNPPGPSADTTIYPGKLTNIRTQGAGNLATLTWENFTGSVIDPLRYTNKLVYKVVCGPLSTNLIIQRINTSIPTTTTTTTTTSTTSTTSTTTTVPNYLGKLYVRNYTPYTGVKLDYVNVGSSAAPWIYPTAPSGIRSAGNQLMADIFVVPQYTTNAVEYDATQIIIYDQFSGQPGIPYLYPKIISSGTGSIPGLSSTYTLELSIINDGLAYHTVKFDRGMGTTISGLTSRYTWEIASVATATKRFTVTTPASGDPDITITITKS